MNSTHDSFQLVITQLLNEKLFVPKQLLIMENWNEPLTGSIFNFSSVKLTYFFMEVEKRFLLRIDKKHLIAYGFCTINQIAEVINQSETFL